MMPMSASASVSTPAPAHSPGSVQGILDASPLSRYQLIAIAVLMGVNGLDGFDAFAINFASPGLAAEWGVAKDTLGVVKSMNLIGMAFGALFIAPMADRFGRRPVILACTTLLAVSMIACAFVESVFTMCVWRVITGLGIGAMLAAITATAAEMSNAKWRALCVSVSATGYLLGAVLGGLASAELLEVYSWRSIFIFGGVISALFVPIIAWRVPETLPFLATRGQAGDLERANAILHKMGHSQARTLQTDGAPPPSYSIWRLFSGDIRAVTLLVTLAYFFQVITFYYYVGWVPDIIADLGHSHSDAARVLTAANLAGVFGALTIGWFASKFGVTAPTFVAAVAGGLAVAAFGAASGSLGVFVAIGAVAGFFLNSTIIMMYAIMARAFPVEIRALGAGFVLGVGRAGGVLGPIVGGVLFEAGLEASTTSFIVAAGSFMCAIIVLFLGPALRRREAA